MNYLVLLFSSFFIFTSSTLEKEAYVQSDLIEVFIFLEEDCRISQYYSKPLKELHEKYSTEKIIFKGIFPSQNTTQKNMDDFKEKYTLPFEMIFDEGQILTKKLGARITPEVIVYNQSKEEIIYKGRIDDSYFRVGKRRQVTTTSELKTVLHCLTNDRPIRVKWKDAIGCFIKKI